MKISFSVIDVFIIVLVLACVAGIVGRYVLTDENGILAVTPETRMAAVHVLVSDIENTSAAYFSEGAVFRMGNGDVTGELREFNEVPAEHYITNENGELEISYSGGDGNKDERCTIIVEGYYKDGIFLLGGREPILPGASIEMANDEIRVTALVLDITSVDS